ncbi:HAD family hydrolase [Curtobacterium flaccumfaciens pv. flaccumfaciens]|uniref:HAD family hydrolase n=1 Tax=Curtobacterium flaccumfaciens TaxID=2035 RepID=UPI003AB5E6B5
MEGPERRRRVGVKVEHAPAEDSPVQPVRPSGYFHPGVLARLQAHQARGDAIVLVSGSVPALLDVLADELGADHVLATKMRVDSGAFTGEIDEPMIGDRKTDAVRELAADCRLDLACSSAYGDHASDVPFLELTGIPVICGTPGTVEWAVAEDRGWSRVLLDGRAPGSPVDR